MFCRKCGNEIPDDSVFGLKCGTKVEIVENKIQEDVIEEIAVTEESDTYTDNETNLPNEEKTETPNPLMHKKTVYSIFGIVAVILTIIIAVAVSENAKKCTLDSCDNPKQEGSEYCSEHTCKADGCTNSKSKYDKYCYTHEQELCCAVEECNSDKIEGGEYCYFHTCEKSGCYEKKFYDTDYCYDHQVDMRKQLTNSSFHFSLNSAGGIEFDFSAKNSTGKEIKYVRFDVELRNAVGDLVEDEIKDTSSVSVEIVGPVKAGETVSIRDEIIGYCDTCARIDIDDITIIYTDGTSETGHFGYYYEK